MHKQKQGAKGKEGKRATARKTSSRRADGWGERKAPVSVGLTRVQGKPLSFSAAARHDEYPEGGLRVVGTCKSSAYNMSSYTGDTAQYGAFWNLVSTVNEVLVPIHLDSTTLPISTSYTLPSPFPTGIRALANRFQKYRFRRLRLHLVSESPTTTPGRIDVGWCRDVPAVLVNTTSNVGNVWASNAQDFAADLFASKSCSAWESMSIDMPQEKKFGQDDELFWINLKDAQTVSSEGAFNQMRVGMQGSFCGYSSIPASVVAATTTTEYSLFFEFELDMYGFMNGVATLVGAPAPGALPASAAGPAIERKTESKTDSKTVGNLRDKDLGRSPDVEFDAILVKSQSQPLLRTEGRQVGLQDEQRGWFGRS